MNKDELLIDDSEKLFNEIAKERRNPSDVPPAIEAEAEAEAEVIPAVPAVIPAVIPAVPAVAQEDIWKDATDKQREEYEDLQSRLKHSEHQHKSNTGRLVQAQKRITELSTKAGDKPADVVGKTAIKSPEQLAAFSDEYPDINEHINAIVQGAAVTQQEDSKAEMKEAIALATANLQRQYDEREYKREQEALLEQNHPNYLDTIGSAEFSTWLNTQDETTKSLSNSYDAIDASELIRVYKKSKPETTQTDSLSLERKRQKQIDDASGIRSRSTRTQDQLAASDDPEALFNQLAKQRKRDRKLN